MHETPEQYRQIVAHEVRILEKICRCRIADGENTFCPRCGDYGTWDLESIGFTEIYGNSVYYSTVFHEWRCRICDFKRCR